jgi:hypothetical protein
MNRQSDVEVHGLFSLGGVSRGWLLVVLVLIALTGSMHSQTGVFDLAGPRIDMHVQRAGKTLPIANVPNLQAGDRLWIHPDLPDSQSARYLMIVVFLRGATNPPPESWFTKVETWTKPVKDEGVFVNVPAEAQQALVFLAPETGGGFGALRAAVRGKPGSFVRASQDLELASLDRRRLEKYLEAVRANSVANADELKKRTVLLARSLNIRLDQQCFDKPTAEQLPCLTEHTDQLVLDDANSQSMVATLTSGDPGHLLSEITYTPKMGGGYYSPYIGAVVDIARILGSAHTAHYQYIPALAVPKDDQLNLRLNNPPSFRNPKSVLVIALPHIGPAVLPRLQPVEPHQIYCLDNPDLVLPVEGAPLVFATGMAHGLFLHVQNNSGQGFDLPVQADAARGGLVVDKQSLPPKSLDGDITATLHGFWGFQTFDGPKFRLHSSHAAKWVVASRDASALIVGRDDTVHLQSGNACCVTDVSLSDQQGKHLETKWKSVKPDELEVQVSLRDAKPGWLTLQVKSFGQNASDEILLHTYAEAGRLDALTIHAGDSEGVLKGTRLDEVAWLELNNIRFIPGDLSRAHQQDELKLAAKDAGAATALHEGDSSVAHVTLKDGRVLDLKVIVGQPRPVVDLVSKKVDMAEQSTDFSISLADANELPQDARLTFVLKSQVPDTFPPGEKVEVATADESFRVMLTMADGNLTLQDTKTLVAVLDPMKHLGPSAFGSLKFRPVADSGLAGAWQPLANLVRIPALKEVRCTPGPERQCSLVGDKLFLLDSVSTDPAFANAVTIPDGFIDQSLAIPMPSKKTLYVKLRDDPGATATVMMPVVTVPVSAPVAAQ